VDVPFVSTPEHVARRMLELANVGPDDVVYDLGAGDGRIIIMAAKEFKARAVGVEIRKDLYERILERVKTDGLEGKVKVINGDFFQIDISEASVVTLYLLTSVNEKLRPKLERELKVGARVVSHDFEVPGWKPIRIESVRDYWCDHKIYVYEIGISTPKKTVLR
ncbi:MAG: methyltransferase domain-containing protein, partial [Candidatus Nezhaarchaeales archaeon]